MHTTSEQLLDSCAAGRRAARRRSWASIPSCCRISKLKFRAKNFSLKSAFLGERLVSCLFSLFGKTPAQQAGGHALESNKKLSRIRLRRGDHLAENASSSVPPAFPGRIYPPAALRFDSRPPCGYLGARFAASREHAFFRRGARSDLKICGRRASACARPDRSHVAACVQHFPWKVICRLDSASLGGAVLSCFSLLIGNAPAH